MIGLTMTLDLAIYIILAGVGFILICDMIWRKHKREKDKE